MPEISQFGFIAALLGFHLAAQPKRQRTVAIPLTLQEWQGMDLEDQYEAANLLFGQCPNVIPSMLPHAQGLTGAQFTEICLKTAIAQYWDHKAA